MENPMSPLYGWSGPGEIREISLQRTRRPEITRPNQVESDVDQATEKRITCTVDGCGRIFKKNMIMARHFNSAHEDLREDKDSWRQWSKEKWE